MKGKEHDDDDDDDTERRKRRARREETLSFSLCLRTLVAQGDARWIIHEHGLLVGMRLYE